MRETASMKRISVMGSTGSIGTQTLDIVRAYPSLFRVNALTANRNWELLAKQAMEFQPEMVVIADERYLSPLKEALAGSGIEVFAGPEALKHAASHPDTDITVCGLVGFSGLDSTISAIKAKKTLALANKETLVVAGSIICRLAKENGTDILPVDSEHSAIFQCIQGENEKSINNLILTASGGPFRKLTAGEMEKVTLKDALAHPNWEMGPKVTIDSATMMNKGFEMMEASWLFKCQPERIKVAVHPQSIVHSMVEFCDGSVKAQLGLPDMHTPIRYALGYPERLSDHSGKKMNISDYATLTFEAPDLDRFPLLKVAYEAAKIGGNAPAVLNAANEVAVNGFIEERIKYTDIYRIVAETMNNFKFTEKLDLETIHRTHEESKLLATEYLKKL